jgi:hypothetical protein
MAQENFNVSEPNDGLGDKLRAAFIKVEANFTDLFTNKVDKEIGKGLSSENYTTTEKDKLANIQDFAEVNVQSDMAQNDETADDFIKNKLSIFGLATTQIINVGSIGNVPIQDVVNLDDGYVIQGQELGIRLVTSNDNGVAKNYLFLAPGGTYGINLLQTVAADFQIFGTEGGGVVINDTTPSLTEVYSSQKVEDELDLIAVEILAKQNTPRLVDTDTTALNNEILHVTADATITDIVDAIAGDFFTVRVLGGIATVGFVAYGLGTLITRNYNGTVWNSQVGGGVGGLRPELIFSEFKGDNYFSQITPNSINNVGYNVNPTAVGTPQFITQNINAEYSANPFDTSFMRQSTSTTTAGSTSAFIWQIKVCRPSLGFYCTAKAGGDFSTNSRNFFGLTESFATIGSVNPSTVINTIGFGADSDNTNLHIIHNDGSGLATKVDLGSDFPKAGQQIYILEMWNFFNETSVYFRIKNLKLNITSEVIEATTNLPTIGLAFQIWANNGIDTLANVVKFTNHTIKRQS